MSDVQLRNLLESVNHIHFIGIGGVGMSGLAFFCASRGFRVTGSDVSMSQTVRRLRVAGCHISIGHASLPQTEMVIYSSAIHENNPERAEARLRKIPLFHRSELLACFMNNCNAVGITGTHGKTTTSALISFLLQESEENPTCFIGSDMVNYGSNVLVGKEEGIVVAEVDESDKSLLNIHPQIAVVTNIEEDHCDTYTNITDLKKTLVTYLNTSASDGVVVYNYDDIHISDIISQIKRPCISFGLADAADFHADNIIQNPAYTHFDLYYKDAFISAVHSPLVGVHNVYNVLAALAAVIHVGMDLSDAIGLIASFQGTARRFEILYDEYSTMICDDYGHHPTEIRATIDALIQRKKTNQRLVVIFQPHRYSRTAHLGSTFGVSFKGADRVVITDIYSAGEDPIEGIDARIIVDAIQTEGSTPVTYVAQRLLMDHLLNETLENTVIAFIGAGDITEIAHEFTESVKGYFVRK